MWEKLRTAWTRISSTAKILYGILLAALLFIFWILIGRWFGQAKPQTTASPVQEVKTIEEMGEVISNKEREIESAKKQRLETEKKALRELNHRRKSNQHLAKHGTNEDLVKALEDEVEK